MPLHDSAIPLERQVASLLAANREDSYATQRKRGYALGSAAKLLHERFGLQKWENLGQKHVAHVVETWKADDTGRRSIDEKLSHLRWLVAKIGKANLVPRSNLELGVEPGPRHTRAGKTVSDEAFAQSLLHVQDEQIRAMMLLARHLGLRFREAALLRPHRDWDGQRVWIKRGSKGGRPRYLYLHNAKQSAALQEARRLTSADGALIPAECRTFEEWRQYVYRQLRGAGIGRGTDRTFHDLRRTYLVERMKFLVWQRKMYPDRAAALVAREAGHARTEILEWYISEVA